MGIAIALAAMLWLLPVATTIDALSHPKEAWRQAGGPREFWIVAPAGLVVATFLTGSMLPLFVGVVLALVYFGRARDAVAIAHGLNDLARGRRPVGEAEFMAIVPAGIALPVAGLAYVVAVTARRPLEALVGVVAGLAAIGLVIAAVIRWRRVRHQSPDS